MSNDPLGQRAIEFLNEQNKYSKQRTKLAEDSFNKNINVTTDHLAKVQYNSNIYVGKPNEKGGSGSSFIGCVKGGIPNEYRVDLPDNLERDTAIDTCLKAAGLAKQPFFSIGSNENADGYICNIGNEDMIKKYDENGSAHMIIELASYNTSMIRKNMGIEDPSQEINNSGGYMKIEDGNLKIYDSAGTLISFENNEYSKAANLYEITDDALPTGKFETETRDFLKTILAISESSPLNTESSEIFGNIFNKMSNDYKYSYLKQSQLDGKKTHTDIQTICNDLENCAGYVYIKHDTDEITWILFKTFEGTILQENTTSQNKLKKVSIYKKPKNTQQSVLQIDNDGNVILKVGGNEKVIMSPGARDKRSFRQNKLFLEETFKDGMGNPRNYLLHGERIVAGDGQYISSPNGIYRARFTDKGVLVLETTSTICPRDNQGREIAYFSSNGGDKADVVYMVNDYRYSIQNKKEVNNPHPNNILKKMEDVDNITCNDECNTDSRCMSYSYYSPETRQYNCELYDQTYDRVIDAPKGVKVDYYTKDNITKDDLIQNIGETGYIDKTGKKMYTYRPDQITYEYTPETKDNMSDWRNGYTLHKDTYISNKEKKRLMMERKFIIGNGTQTEIMNIDMCANYCTDTPNCGEFAYYEKEGDKVECGLIKKGAVFDKVPSEFGSTYKRIPKVKNSETDISIGRKVINVGTNIWRRFANNISGEMGPIVKGPKAEMNEEIDKTNVDNLSSFTTLKEAFGHDVKQSTNFIKVPKLKELENMLRDRKKVTKNSVTPENSSDANIEPQGFRVMNNKLFNGFSNIKEGLTQPTNMTAEEWNKLLENNESYKAYGELKKVENEHRRTKDSVMAMEETSYYELERQNSITINLIILAVVTGIFGYDFIRYSSK